MSAQESLWPAPLWTSRYEVGDRVCSAYTHNQGTVVTVVAGRHLLVRWDATERWEPYVVRHSSPQGLEVVEP